jgi:uncharacterized protein (DUF433 family)
MPRIRRKYLQHNYVTLGGERILSSVGPDVRIDRTGRTGVVLPGYDSTEYPYGGRRYFGRRAPWIDAVKFHAWVVHAYMQSKFTAADLALFGYLIHFARNHCRGGHANTAQYVIPKRHCETFLGTDFAGLEASLIRLMQGRILCRYADEAGKTHTFGSNLLNFDIERGGRGTLTFSFPHTLNCDLMNPAVYSLIHLEVLRKFQTTAGAKLFLLLQRIVGIDLANNRYIELTRYEMHWMLGLMAGTKTLTEGGLFKTLLEVAPWNDFDRRVLRRAIDEVNRHTGINVYYQQNCVGKGGRIYSVTFFVETKLHSTAKAPAGVAPPQAAIKNSLFERRVGRTIYGALPVAKKYAAPATMHPNSPHRGLLFETTREIEGQVLQMWKSAGMSGEDILAETIVSYLRSDCSPEEIMRGYPSLPADGIDAVARWAEATYGPRWKTRT